VERADESRCLLLPKYQQLVRCGSLDLSLCEQGSRYPFNGVKVEFNQFAGALVANFYESTTFRVVQVVK